MTTLSVNVNKLATLRNSRGKNNPDVVQTSLDLVRFGAEGITVHPRPDERHIRKADVFALNKAIDVELNIEGFPTEEFLAMVETVKPAQCTLVPDPPHVLTSNAGWNVSENRIVLEQVAKRMRAKKIRTSVFVDPDTTTEEDYAHLAKMGIDRVELFTERFAEKFTTGERADVTFSYKRAAMLAKNAGLGVNAGHDLSRENLAGLIEAIPWIDEVSIGHALICDALYLGLETTVRLYRDCIRKGQEAALRSNRG
jgi:pyridoxine 5-phosphate synthase